MNVFSLSSNKYLMIILSLCCSSLFHSSLWRVKVCHWVPRGYTCTCTSFQTRSSQQLSNRNLYHVKSPHKLVGSRIVINKTKMSAVYCKSQKFQSQNVAELLFKSVLGIYCIWVYLGSWNGTNEQKYTKWMISRTKDTTVMLCSWEKRCLFSFYVYRVCACVDTMCLQNSLNRLSHKT